MRDDDEEVIAILCADIHLSLNPPIWRSVEPNWFEAMKRPLNEIRTIQEKFNCPIICAGEIFDRWNSLPELVNFALEYLPENMVSIPGQHELPLHKYEDIKKSAYWTLAEAKKILDLSPDTWSSAKILGNIILHGFPYGFPVQPPAKRIDGINNGIHIAVVHEYVWVKGHSYQTAPQVQKLKNVKLQDEKWMGYDIVIYGDNHKGFSTTMGKTKVFNCGTLMRRKSDEIDYKPQIGLLLKSGRIQPFYLDISKDKYLDLQTTILTEESFDIGEFIQELEKLGDTDLDFSEAMEQYLRKNKIKGPICNVIRKAMGL